MKSNQIKANIILLFQLFFVGTTGIVEGPYSCGQFLLQDLDALSEGGIVDAGLFLETFHVIVALMEILVGDLDGLQLQFELLLVG